MHFSSSNASAQMGKIGTEQQQQKNKNKKTVKKRSKMHRFSFTGSSEIFAWQKKRNRGQVLNVCGECSLFNNKKNHPSSECGVPGIRFFYG